jgi:nucleoside-diphosphate-sugar epimerase
MRCLVMGGNRYIGLSLVHELARRGDDVTVMNSHEARLPETVRRFHGDRRQPGVIREMLGPHRDEFDVVFDNTAYRPSDLEPMIELFGGRVEHFVFTSSVAVYLPSCAQPVDEAFPRCAPDTGGGDPRRAYAGAKVGCEDLLLGLHARSGFPATCLRVSHTVGPRSPLPSRDPAVFARLELHRPILVPGDGFPFVHTVHIDDAARAMAWVSNVDSAVGQIYNVAGSQFASVVGHIELMARTVGVEPHIVYVPLSKAVAASPPLIHWGEALTGGMVFDISKAQQELGWSPSFDAAQGYQDSYEWFCAGGRDSYDFDFSRDEQILAALDGP